MIRPLAVFAALALTLGTSAAQEIAPPATSDIVIDPAATLNTTPKQANMLTGFYATLAVIDICAIAIEPDVTAGMDADRKRLETSLGMDPATAETAYAQVKADVEKTTPDCAEGSEDRRGVDAVTAIYTDAGTATPAPTPTAPPAGTVTTDTPAAPAQ
ncbi:hypothetical protein [Devosia ginsengisoli]|uniref:Uncharacterized protein n=1 Tax=Devosia ginsengisoli TaxID=400770 RepID=A0A5B8LXG4_9HYPH|nr:hypothetical protein [Devosia ginsengisoli]QDZ12275.1 hypothetical protein FPZ08_16890 [Devosia ginsengisoli]